MCDVIMLRVMHSGTHVLTVTETPHHAILRMLSHPGTWDYWLGLCRLLPLQAPGGLGTPMMGRTGSEGPAFLQEACPETSLQSPSSDPGPCC